VIIYKIILYIDIYFKFNHTELNDMIKCNVSFFFYLDDDRKL